MVKPEVQEANVFVEIRFIYRVKTSKGWKRYMKPSWALRRLPPGAAAVFSNPINKLITRSGKRRIFKQDELFAISRNDPAKGVDGVQDDE